MENLEQFINTLKSPALLMQSEPRQVVTANQKACELFGKSITQIKDYRGGQVFDCIHSFTEAGCGKDINCQNCKIKNAVVATFDTGKPHRGIHEVLEIKKNNETKPYELQISTEKNENYVVVTIEKYKKIA